MAITFVAATEAGTGAASTTQVINVPAGVADDDFLLALIGTADGDTGSVSLSGTWQGPLVNNLNVPTAPSPPGASVYWRIASSEPASYTITDTESSGIAGQMLAFRGVDTTTPIDVTTTTSTGDGANAAAPSINYLDTGAAIVIGAWWDSTTAVYSAQPSGYTSPSGLGAIVGNGGGNGLSLVTGYDLTPAADPEVPGTFTSSAEQWAAFTVALRTAAPQGQGMMLASADRLITAAAAENPGVFDFASDVPWGAITIALREDTTPTGDSQFVPGSRYTSLSPLGVSLNLQVTDTTVIDGGTINGDLQLDVVNHLTNVTITGDLNIQAAGTYNFSNVTVNGDTLNNDAAGNATINASNGSSLTTTEPGTGNGLVNIVSSVPITVTITSPSSREGAAVRLVAVGDIVVLDGETNSSGVASTTYGGAVPVAIDSTKSWVRDGSAATPYQEFILSGTIGAAGYDQSVILSED
jgi:hypothetical protein